MKNITNNKTIKPEMIKTNAPKADKLKTPVTTLDKIKFIIVDALQRPIC